MFALRRLAEPALRRFYRFILKRTVGKFLLDDIELDEIDVHLREGRMELRNLRLNARAIDALLQPLPVVVASGSVRCIRANISYQRLRTEGCMIELEGLVIRIAPPGTESDGFCPPTKPATAAAGEAHSAAAVQKARETERNKLFETYDGVEADPGLEIIAEWIEDVTARVRVTLRDVVVQIGAADGSAHLEVQVPQLEVFDETPGLDSADSGRSPGTGSGMLHSKLVSQIHKAAKCAALHVDLCRTESAVGITSRQRILSTRAKSERVTLSDDAAVYLKAIVGTHGDDAGGIPKLDISMFAKDISAEVTPGVLPTLLALSEQFSKEHHPTPHASDQRPVFGLSKAEDARAFGVVSAGAESLADSLSPDDYAALEGILQAYALTTNNGVARAIGRAAKGLFTDETALETVEHPQVAPRSVRFGGSSVMEAKHIHSDLDALAGLDAAAGSSTGAWVSRTGNIDGGSDSVLGGSAFFGPSDAGASRSAADASFADLDVFRDCQEATDSLLHGIDTPGLEARESRAEYARSWRSVRDLRTRAATQVTVSVQILSSRIRLHQHEIADDASTDFIEIGSADASFVLLQSKLQSTMDVSFGSLFVHEHVATGERTPCETDGGVVDADRIDRNSSHIVYPRVRFTNSSRGRPALSSSIRLSRQAISTRRDSETSERLPDVMVSVSTADVVVELDSDATVRWQEYLQTPDTGLANPTPIPARSIVPDMVSSPIVAPDATPADAHTTHATAMADVSIPRLTCILRSPNGRLHSSEVTAAARAFAQSSYRDGRPQPPSDADDMALLVEVCAVVEGVSVTTGGRSQPERSLPCSANTTVAIEFELASLWVTGPLELPSNGPAQSNPFLRKPDLCVRPLPTSETRVRLPSVTIHLPRTKHGHLNLSREVLGAAATVAGQPVYRRAEEPGIGRGAARSAAADESGGVAADDRRDTPTAADEQDRILVDSGLCVAVDLGSVLLEVTSATMAIVNDLVDGHWTGTRTKRSSASTHEQSGRAAAPLVFVLGCDEARLVMHPSRPDSSGRDIGSSPRASHALLASGVQIFVVSSAANNASTERTVGPSGRLYTNRLEVWTRSASLALLRRPMPHPEQLHNPERDFSDCIFHAIPSETTVSAAQGPTSQMLSVHVTQRQAGRTSESVVKVVAAGIALHDPTEWDWISSCMDVLLCRMTSREAMEGKPTPQTRTSTKLFLDFHRCVAHIKPLVPGFRSRYASDGVDSVGNQAALSIGVLRMRSNMLSWTTSQAFKITAADLRVYLANQCEETCGIRSPHARTLYHLRQYCDALMRRRVASLSPDWRPPLSADSTGAAIATVPTIASEAALVPLRRLLAGMAPGAAQVSSGDELLENTRFVRVAHLDRGAVDVRLVPRRGASGSTTLTATLGTLRLYTCMDSMVAASELAAQIGSDLAMASPGSPYGNYEATSVPVDVFAGVDHHFFDVVGGIASESPMMTASAVHVDSNVAAAYHSNPHADPRMDEWESMGGGLVDDTPPHPRGASTRLAPQEKSGDSGSLGGMFLESSTAQSVAVQLVDSDGLVSALVGEAKHDKTAAALRGWFADMEHDEKPSSTSVAAEPIKVGHAPDVSYGAAEPFAESNEDTTGLEEFDVIDMDDIERHSEPGSEELLPQVAHWFDGKRFSAQIFPQHFGILRIQSHGGGSSLDACGSKYRFPERKFAAVGTEKLTVVLSTLDVRWRVFGGFDWCADSSAVPPSPSTFGGAETPVPPRAGSSKRDLRSNVVENYVPDAVSGFDTQAGPPPSDVPSVPRCVAPPKPPRQLDHMLELCLLGIGIQHCEFDCLPAGDTVGDKKSWTLQTSTLLAVRDVDVQDRIQSSKLKSLVSYWATNSLHRREEGEPCVQVRVDQLLATPATPTVFVPAQRCAGPEHDICGTILPLRVSISQETVTFARSLLEHTQVDEFDTFESVTGEDGQEPADSGAYGDGVAPASRETAANGAPAPLDRPVFFMRQLLVDEIVLKIDYIPTSVDRAALWAGQYSELINLIPISGLRLTLGGVRAGGVEGWDQLGRMIGVLWAEDITRHQLHHVLASINASLLPMRTVANLGSGAADLVLVPLSHYRKHGASGLGRGILAGTSSFARTAAVETLSLASRVAGGMQAVLQSADGLVATGEHGAAVRQAAEHAEARGAAQPVHTRHARQPTGVAEGFVQAYATLMSSMQDAAHTIVAIPAAEFRRRGVSDAAKAVVKGVPIAVLRPLIGSSEATKRAILGLRNALDPTMRVELDKKFKHSE